MALLIAHVPAIGTYALISGRSPTIALTVAGLPTVTAILGATRRLGRQTRSAMAAIGLVLCSSITVHLANGAIEAHFHFFVMIPLIALYEDWVPFGLGAGFVLLEHGVIGTMLPYHVYDHPAAWLHPWRFAAVHAAFFTGACIASVVHWRLQESAQAAEQDLVAQLAYAAGHDELTGLTNRAAMVEEGGLILAEAARGRRPVAVLVLGLDRFKDVNDTLGHQYGDDLLTHVSRCLHQRLRSADRLARLGGDEFAVMVPDADCAAAIAVAERLRAALEESLPMLAGVEIAVSASIGIAVGQLDVGQDQGGCASTTVESGSEQQEAYFEQMSRLLRQAEVAMYDAKAGRLGVAVYDPDRDDNTPDRLAMLADLRRALDSDQLVLHYQPKVSLTDGRIVGAEALVRWNHPQRGMVPPMDFIPLAEATHLIEPMTHIIIRKAVAQIGRWRTAGLELPVAVNVSPNTVVEGGLPDLVRGVLAESDVPGRLLRLEITESTLVSDPDGALRTLRDLHDLGVQISIDDFGTGYSSLSYLKHLPVDELKVDRSFVAGLLTSTEDEVLVRATVDLGHNLGMSVVAEGVEEEPAADALRAMGCDVAQGFLYSRPLPAVELFRMADPRERVGSGPAEDGTASEMVGVN
jgi:diguanylate cyclase (GGDEF)-like protein